MDKPSLVNSKDVSPSDRFDDVFTEYLPDAIFASERNEQEFLFETKAGIYLKINVLTSSLFRIRYALNGQFEKDFSYAIAPDFKSKTIDLQFIEKDNYFQIISSQVECQVAKKNARIKMLDNKGKVINKDAAGFSACSTIMKGISKVAITKKSPKKEQFFGMGDKSCALDLRGQHCENYNTDAFAYGAGSYPLYRSIPFYYGLNKGIGYGIFMDNTFRSHFEFDTNGDNTTTFWAEGGEMNYYFIYGPELLNVAKQYHKLTGATPLPAMWALGFHQCRWSYYPDARVRQVAETFRKEQIPCDAIYLDIDYMDGYRCFTVNENIFPDLKGLVADLKKDGFSTIVMIDPGIKEDDQYWVYTDGISQDVFCRRTNGAVMKGPVWPDSCVFPDFTHPNARAWWEDLYQELYGDFDIAGFWNDMNEPAVFKVNSKTFPDEVAHHYEGIGGTHRRTHNIYGMQMSRATQSGLSKIKPDERPFVLTRATYSGGQRHGAVWTGDNIATWEHLQIANIQCQRLSISGFSLAGSDVGGFVDQPTGEMMARWIQLAVFHPLFRIHSMGNNADGSGAVHDNIMELDAKDRKDQEPWSYGKKYTKINRTAIELRYRLLPYLYSAFYQQTVDGSPVLRSMSFYDQKDEKLCKEERDFMFGENILVSPIIRPKAKFQIIYLPKGTWYDFYTSKKYSGKKTIRRKVGIDHIPLFVKAGTVLPMHPVRQHTKEKIDFLDLHIYPGNGVSMHFEDAGNGFEYRKGVFRKTTFVSIQNKKGVKIEAHQEGKYKVPYTTINLFIHGASDNSSVIIDNKELPLKKTKKGILTASISNMFKILELK